MRTFALNKTVLRVGPGAEKFLGGLTSNTLEKPYNAFLNLHGRIVATFDQVRVREGEFLIAVESPFVKDLLDHAARYLKLSGTQMTPSGHGAFFDLDGARQLQSGEYGIAQKAGRMVLSAEVPASTVSEEEFTLFRLRHHIPLQGKDYHNELLLNVSEDEFVSFTKGCYLGQEPVSKVHNRSRPTWKLSVAYEDACPPEDAARMTSRAVDPATGRVMGFVFVRNN